MKICILVLAFVAYAAAGAIDIKAGFTVEEIARYNKFKKECMEELKVDAAVIEAFDKGVFPVDYKDTKCYHKCLIGKCGYLDDKDNFNQEKMKAYLLENHHEKQWQVVEKCLKVVEDADKCQKADICEKAYNVNKCKVEHIKQIKELIGTFVTL